MMDDDRQTTTGSRLKQAAQICRPAAFRKAVFTVALAGLAALFTGPLASYDDEDEPEYKKPVEIPDPNPGAIQYRTMPFKAIWSKGSDLAPAISYDSSEMYFESDRLDGKSYRIFHARLKGLLELESQPRLVNLLKGASFEGLPYLTSKGEFLFFSAIHKKNYRRRKVKNMEADIYFARRLGKRADGHRFDKPVHMRTPVNSPYSELTPCLSVDGRFLYFSSNRPGGYGGYDIYVSEWNGKTWGVPVNAGNDVNSESNEIFPRIFPDSSRIYFSSDRPGGLGGYDIYHSSRSKADKWENAVNAGAYINTVKNDYLNNVPLFTEFFLVTRGESGSEKIYGITPVPDEMRPLEMVLGSFVARDIKSKKLLPFELQVLDSKGRKVFEDSFEPPLITAAGGYRKTDSIVKTLRAGSDYQIFVTAAGYMFYSEQWTVPSGEPYYSKEILLEPLREGVSIPVHNLYFYPNTPVLKKSSRSIVLAMAAFLRKNPLTIRIEGHTARVASADKAMKLSQARALSVKKMLNRLGVSAGRIETSGFGFNRPFTRDQKKRHLNRRVDIRILKLK